MRVVASELPSEAFIRLVYGRLDPTWKAISCTRSWSVATASYHEVAQHSFTPSLLGAPSRCETAAQPAHRHRAMPVLERIAHALLMKWTWT